MKYHALFVIFEKVAKIFNRRLLQIIGGALRVNSFQKFVQEHYQSKFIQEHNQSAKSFGSRLGPKFCRS